MKKLILVSMLALLSANANAEVLECNVLKSSNNFYIDQPRYFNVHRDTGNVDYIVSNVMVWDEGYHFITPESEYSGKGVIGIAFLSLDAVTLRTKDDEIIVIDHDKDYDYKQYEPGTNK